MIPRFVVSAAVGGLVTFGLFYLMHLLIAGADARPDDGGPTTRIEFVRIKQESEVQEKERKMPDKTPPKEPPPPPPMALSKSSKPSADGTGMMNDFSIAGDVGDMGGASIGGTVDTDEIPLVMILPTYPPRASEKGIEGWVLVQFSISPRGTVEDPKVVGFEPSKIFNNAALRAIRKWKYNPRIVNGKPVGRKDVRKKLMFTLPKGQKPAEETAEG